MDYLTREYGTLHSVSGPLLFVEKVRRVSVGEMVAILLPDGRERRGQVIEISDRHAVIQVLEATAGISTTGTRLRFSENVARMGLSPDILGRRFNGVGEPIDGLPEIIPERWVGIIGSPINPVARDKPGHFIQTGLSTVDGLNTLVRGQKLPIFSGSGLPAKEIAAQILRQAKVIGEEAEFAIVFAAMGITFREASFFLEEFEKSGVSEHTVVFLNLADDPTIERLLTPRFALTAAEYLAFTRNRHVLVILTDITNYCEALREIATAREEIPGRRGYPGYMYTDLAMIYERAGRIKGLPGSVTQLPILTMPDDDITHPIPDLTGYITEGQIVLSRDLHRKGIYPPIDVLPSLSRLMNLGIGEGKTRADHRGVADQLYAFYAQGRDLRRLAAIVGEEGLTESDKRLLQFAERFEREFVSQGGEERRLEQTLDLGWSLLGLLPKERLTRIKPEFVQRFYKG
ncbi:MAG TPA: V-type ATP synthase subunit B [Nitrospiria bacterium]|nr:V-type ATP synthase subunit B [Nitrospiria bacterium]